MYESFGAVATGSTVRFTVFFPDNLVDPTQYQRGGSPNIKTLRVTGNFQSAAGGIDWDYTTAPALTLQPHLNGWIYVAEVAGLPDGFYEYKYFVEFNNGTSRWCSDPCSKYGGFGNENSGFVIGGGMLTPIPLANRLPLDRLIIYELMLDDFTAEYRAGRAPLDAVLDKLDYLQTLGVNAIELMPTGFTRTPTTPLTSAASAWPAFSMNSISPTAASTNSLSTSAPSGLANTASTVSGSTTCSAITWPTTRLRALAK